MRWMWVLPALAGGCYRPAVFEDCAIHCVDVCPTDMVCHAGTCVPETDPTACEASTPDAPISAVDAPTSDTGAGVVCFGGTYLPTSYCSTLVSLRPLTNVTLDGGIDATCDDLVSVAGGPDLCVIRRSEVQVEAGITLRLTGSRAIVLVANTITINGTIDASGKPLERGAGGVNRIDCDAAAPPNGAGGGGGGGFVTGGGAGGQDATAVLGGAGGKALMLDRIRGGCDGASGSGPSMGGPGGFGGGAIYLRAQTIQGINGAILAMGGGGDGALPGSSGGGGGGSGGLIVVNAASFQFNAMTVRANGAGGGGGGGTAAKGNAGSSLGDGGLGGNASGGAGGPGALVSGAGLGGGNGATAGTAGGGGGGGIGAIQFFNDTISQPAPPGVLTIFPPAS